MDGKTGDGHEREGGLTSYSSLAMVAVCDYRGARGRDGMLEIEGLVMG